MKQYLNLWGRKKLPITLQTEATECGLACLIMVSQYHGHNIDLNSLRQRYPVSLKGASLEGLINIAAQLDLGTRAVRAELEALKKIATPAILHWDLNHFVVLKKVQGNKVYVHDPAYGLRVMTLEKASDHFTGVVLELSPTNNFKKQDVRNKLRLSQFWQRLYGLKKALVHLFIFSFILQLIGLASPLYLQFVVDEAISKFDGQLLFVLAAGFLGITIIQHVTSFMRGWTTLYFGNQISFQMVANLFNHLIHLPTSYFEKRHVGDILSRIGSTSPIQKAITESLIAGILDGIMATITGIVIFFYSPFLGMIVIIALLINFVLTLIFYPVLRRTQEENIIAGAKESSHSIETIRAATAIKLFSVQNQRLSIWRNLFADKINTGIAMGRNELILGTLHGLVGTIQNIVVIYFGAKLILSNDNLFTIGMMFAFMSYSGNFIGAMTSLFGKFVEFRLLGLHLDRISDIVQAEPEKISSYDAEEFNEVTGKIEFRSVSFRYSEDDPWILRKVNFTIEANEFVVLIGPSGGGKSTLLKLIMGLYKPTKGDILIDGVALSEINYNIWRKKIGVVMQDDQLLSGSIADNISFFDPDLNMKQVREAAVLAHLHRDIISMPMKYLSFIGDMGSALSGGQKQRVLLARALYRTPSVLCLDEGTANIDSKTEEQIVRTISNIQITRVAIAHRPKFVEQATKRYVVYDTKVEEWRPEWE